MLISQCADKIFKGETPTDQEWNDHLIEAHKLAPGMTANAFAGFQTLKEQNSYEILANTLNDFSDQAVNVLDLACGDGHLIGYILPKLAEGSGVVGVDMSEAELALACATYTDSNISFVQARVQELPLDEESQDVILCHMALMLMVPLEIAADEISRVLKPGGIFSAVMGNPRARQKFWGETQGFVFNYIDTHFPLVKEASMGDSRVYTDEGLSEFFSKDLGFSKDIEGENFELQIAGSPENVWQLTKDMYLVGMLPADKKQELESALKSFVAKHPLVSKGQSFGFPMRKITITKL